MLKPLSNNDCQRRPTRILTSYESQSRMREAAATSGSSSSVSRLKCSTISKVPPAKSRLVKQQTSDSRPPQPQQQSEQESQKPSRLARLSVARGLRPNSLAVNKGEPSQVTGSLTSTTARLSSSSNPVPAGGKSNRLEQANKSLFTQRAPQSCANPETRNTTTTTTTIAKKHQLQSTVKRKYSTTTTATTSKSGK